jgi:predicted acetyltransferase
VYGKYDTYEYLDEYWNSKDRYPYLFKVQGNLAGFVFVRFVEEEPKYYYSIAEFFVMKKYRRVGIGKKVAKRIFDLHKGDWEVSQVEKNKPAQQFWVSVINEYTEGKYTERKEGIKTIQAFASKFMESCYI